MKNQIRGFTLIELIIFIIVSSILATSILLVFAKALQQNPTSRQLLVAVNTAETCMEWFIGQRKINGYSNLSCPNSTVPSFCTAPTGYSITTNISCTTIGSDTNYKTIVVTVSGLGDATLTSLISLY